MLSVATTKSPETKKICLSFRPFDPKTFKVSNASLLSLLQIYFRVIAFTDPKYVKVRPLSSKHFFRYNFL